MSSLTHPLTRYQAPHRLTRGVMLLIALAGMGLNGYLLFNWATETRVLGCGPKSSCDAVLNSTWSMVMGIPVTLPALMIYAGILTALFFISPGRSHATQRRAWMMLIVLGIVAAAAAGWFLAIQFLLIDAVCIYCLTIHACSLLLAGLILSQAPIGRVRVMPDDPIDPMMIAPPKAGVWMTVSVLAVAMFAAMQWMAPTAITGHHMIAIDTETPQLPHDDATHIHFLLADDPDPVTLERRAWPVIGSPDAQLVIVFLFDYTCPHCRQMHHLLREAVEHHSPDRVAVMLLPTPLNSTCNPHILHDDPPQREACELAALALNVWRLDPTGFQTFDRWLFESPQPRSAAEARAHTLQHVDDTALRESEASDWAQRMLAHSTALYGRAGAGPLPMLFTRRASVSGTMSRPALWELIEGHLGPTPQ